MTAPPVTGISGLFDRRIQGSYGRNSAVNRLCLSNDEFRDCDYRFTPIDNVNNDAPAAMLEDAFGFAAVDVLMVDEDGDKALNREELAQLLLGPYRTPPKYTNAQKRLAQRTRDALKKLGYPENGSLIDILNWFSPLAKQHGYEGSIFELNDFLRQVRAPAELNNCYESMLGFADQYISVFDAPDTNQEKDGKLDIAEWATVLLYRDDPTGQIHAAAQQAANISDSGDFDSELAQYETTKNGFHPSEQDGMVTKTEHNTTTMLLMNLPHLVRLAVGAIHEKLKVRAHFEGFEAGS